MSKPAYESDTVESLNETREMYNDIVEAIGNTFTQKHCILTTGLLVSATLNLCTRRLIKEYIRCKIAKS